MGATCSEATMAPQMGRDMIHLPGPGDIVISTPLRRQDAGSSLTVQPNRVRFHQV